MLSLFRRILDTWIAKLFFLLMAVAFVYWGVSGSAQLVGTDTNIASVDGQAITPSDFALEFARAEKTAAAKAPNGALSGSAKTALGNQVLLQMIYSAAINAEAKRQGLAVSDDAVRQQLWTIKAFQGTDGKFDQTTFKQVLTENNLTENQFIAQERKDLLQAELLDSIDIGAGASAELTNRIFGYEAQTRRADVVLFQDADQAPPADPTDLQLQRYYADHLSKYATPEYRKVKFVVLSADSLAKSQNVTDAEAQAVYKNNLSTYVLPEKRTVQVLVIADQAKAQSLAAAWAKNPDWAAIQKLAQAAGGSGVEIDKTAKADFPTPALADAVFAAAVNQQIGPVQAGLGWQVARVTAITPGSTTSFEQAEPAIKTALATEKAATAIYDQADKLEDAIGSSSDLSQVPANVGAEAAEGTLDANGNTQDGTPAPLPATGDARTQIVADAFATSLNQPAEFKQTENKAGTTPTFYALTVEQITPSSHKPYADVTAQVRSDWIENQRRHEAEEAAAKMLTALQSGVQTMASAAGSLNVIHSSELYRDGTPADVPAQITDPVFAAAKLGDATMAETSNGFAVAQLTKITTPTRDADPLDWEKLRTQLAQSMRSDIENTYTDALRNAAKIHVNNSLLATAVQ